MCMEYLGKGKTFPIFSHLQIKSMFDNDYIWLLLNMLPLYLEHSINLASIR